MNADEMKKCPYCAEMIRAEAVKCRYCGSMLAKKPPGWLGSPQGYWHRVNDGKKIAGVCTGIAHQLDAPVLILWLRVFFAITTLVYMFGPILYVLLWLLMPAPVEEGQSAGQPDGTTVNPPETPPFTVAETPPAVQNYPGSSEAAPMAQPPSEQPAADKQAGTDNSVKAEENHQDEGTIALNETEPDGQEPGKK